MKSVYLPGGDVQGDDGILSNLDPLVLGSSRMLKTPKDPKWRDCLSVAHKASDDLIVAQLST